MPRHSFTKTQRQRLTRLKLTPGQIDALEKRALRAIASTAEPFRYGEMRAPLKDIEKQARDLAQRIERLPTSPDAGARQAFFHLIEADIAQKADEHVANPANGYPEGPAPDELAIELRRLAKLARSVLAKVEGRQGKNRMAHPYPIRAIVDSLLESWVAEHQCEGKPLPAYDLEVSYTPNSRFRQIAGICYQAAGHPNPDPERSIKAYIADKKKRDSWLVDLVKQSTGMKSKQTAARRKTAPAVR